MTENVYVEGSEMIDAADEAFADEAFAEAAAAEEVMVLDELDDPELVLPVWEPTGEPRVDATLDALSLLDGAAVSEHAAVFDDVHAGLRQVLADLDADRL